MIKAEFVAKQNDYETFKSYLLFHANSEISFDNFKNRILKYLQDNLAIKAPEMIEETKNNIQKIKFEKPSAAFDFGFAENFETEKQTIIAYLQHKEAAVNKIKSGVGDSLFAMIDFAKTPEKQISVETSRLIEAIENLTQNCDDAEAREKYRTELHNLVANQIIRENYFFRELLESITERESVRIAKIGIRKLLQEFSASNFHQSMVAESQNFKTVCLNRLQKIKFSKFEIDNLRLKLEALKTRSNAAVEEDAIRQKEHLFLKAQIISNLENMGYEVMDDLEIIDFEKQGEFLLKIHDQNNYLNLKFREDGSMRYVFQIPEKREELSTDKKQKKFGEMKVTCDEFQTILGDLAKMGLNVNLNSEQPIDEKALITVPKFNRGKLRSKTSQAQKQQPLVKKYLG